METLTSKHFSQNSFCHVKPYDNLIQPTFSDTLVTREYQLIPIKLQYSYQEEYCKESLNFIIQSTIKEAVSVSGPGCLCSHVF